VSGSPERLTTRRAEAIATSVHGAAPGAHAADPGFTQLPQRLLGPERSLEPPELAIGAQGALHLPLHQLGAVLLQARQLDHEPAEVAELDLAQAAKVASAAPDPASLQERRGRVDGLGRWRRRGRLGLCGVP
jgi:hypothetical protein